MPGVVPVYQDGPVTRQVTETVKGGQLVEARSAGLVGVAAVGSKVCLGVASKDAVPTATSQDGTDSVTGLPIINEYPYSPYVAVYDEGYFNLTYAAAAAFGQKLKCAANGQVTPFVSGTDTPDMLVGSCQEPLGVASGAVGLTHIDIQ